VACAHSQLLLAGIAVGVGSSVFLYVCDQLPLARLPRATIALLLSLLPASAVLIGVLVLRQLPTPVEILAIALSVCGVAIHLERQTSGTRPRPAHETSRAAGNAKATAAPDAHLPG
jgi:inner membrane transporter RhtA